MVVSGQQGSPHNAAWTDHCTWGVLAHRQGPGPPGSCEPCSAPARPATPARGLTPPSLRPPSEASRYSAFPEGHTQCPQDSGAEPGAQQVGTMPVCKDTSHIHRRPKPDEQLHGPEMLSLICQGPLPSVRGVRGPECTGGCGDGATKGSPV